MKRYMKKIHTGIIVIAAFVAVLGLVHTGVISTNIAYATGDHSTCTDPNPERDLSGSLTNAGGGSITNKSSVCSYPVGLASYKMFNSNIATQILIDSDLKTIAPKSTVTFTVDIPACAYQIDLFYGDLIVSFANGARYSDRLLAAEQRGKDNYCATETPKLEITKSAPYSIEKGNDIEFTFTVKNTGNVEAKNVVVTDSIQDGLTYKSSNPANTCSIVAGRVNDIECNLGTIAANATKTFKVVFTTASTLACDSKIINRAEVKGTSVSKVDSNTTETKVKCHTEPYTFTVVCAANATQVTTGTNVVWTATDTATGTKTYSWSGTNDLSGATSVVNKTYTSAGTKNATVEVTSQGVTKSATCKIVVKTPPVVPNPTVVCTATPSSAKTGETITWGSSATGGSGSGYTYSWTGTNGLSASTATTTKVYTTTGTKTGTVTVTDSNGKTDSAQCSVTITETPVIPNDPQVVCAANPSSGNIGTNVVWTATATGGNNVYTYSWSGTDGLSATTATTSKTYTTVGTKDATVVVTSNGKTATSTCSMNITTPPVIPPPSSTATFDAVCVVNPTNPRLNETVTFRVDPFGGSNEVYTYSWSGDELISGTGQSVSKAYTTTGVKEARVVITSGNRSITKTCTVTISNSNVTVTTIPNQVAGVYLTQVPYTGLKENALIALAIMAAIGSMGLIAFMYTKKRNEYAYAVASTAVESKKIPAVDAAAVLSTAVESYARSQSASISADAIEAIVKASNGNVDWAKAVINQVVSAHNQNDWTLITLDSVRKIYPHI